MTRKPRNWRPPVPRQKCSRCGSTDAKREGDDLVCDNCNSMMQKDKFKR